MSHSKSKAPPVRRPEPQAALDALLEGPVGDPIRRALWLDALDLRLRPYLPPSLAAHVQLANIDGDKLVYLVDSPVWHARLRLFASELLNHARSIGLNVTQLIVKTSLQHKRTPLTHTPVARPLVPISARHAFEAALASLRAPTNKSGKDNK